MDAQFVTSQVWCAFVFHHLKVFNISASTLQLFSSSLSGSVLLNFERARECSLKWKEGEEEEVRKLGDGQEEAAAAAAMEEESEISASLSLSLPHPPSSFSLYRTVQRTDSRLDECLPNNGLRKTIEYPNFTALCAQHGGANDDDFYDFISSFY